MAVAVLITVGIVASSTAAFTVAVLVALTYMLWVTHAKVRDYIKDTPYRRSRRLHKKMFGE